MMNTDDAQHAEFCRVGKEMGLLGESPYECPFWFYINLGDVWIPSEIDTILRILRLAKELSPDYTLRSLLAREALVAHLHEYEAGKRSGVWFDRRYNEEQVITFSDWLVGKGVDLSEFRNANEQ